MNKPIKRPKSITVLGQKFTLKSVESVDADTWGRTFMGHQNIEITDGLAHEQERDTGLHETIHAIMRILGVFEDNKQEEKVVAAVTPALLDTLKSNPKFTAWLLATRKGNK